MHSFYLRVMVASHVEELTLVGDTSLVQTDTALHD